MPNYPEKLRPGDQLRVIAPSRSWSSICSSEVEKDAQEHAVRTLEGLGLRVTLGQHVWEGGPFDCAPVQHRLDDLHDAFSDPDVRGIITVIGGSNANQLLEEIDFELVGNNPKIFCGYSDITVLHNAFLRKANLVTYYGPHISTFGMKKGISYTVDSFRSALMQSAPYSLEPSAQWAEDAWFLDQEDRVFQENPGLRVLQGGECEGRIVGGNLSTLGLLTGTPYLPELEGALLFVEDPRHIREVDRVLQGLTQCPGGDRLGGLVIGRLPTASEPSLENLEHLVQTKRALAGKPVLYGADFGHTTPHCTFPIGGRARLRCSRDSAEIRILEH